MPSTTSWLATPANSDTTTSSARQIWRQGLIRIAALCWSKLRGTSSTSRRYRALDKSWIPVCSTGHTNRTKQPRRSLSYGTCKDSQQKQPALEIGGHQEVLL